MFGERDAYGRDRKRVAILIDDQVQAEFFGSDNFQYTGDLISELKVEENGKVKMCRYPDDAIPVRYALFPLVGIPLLVNASGVHNAWAALVNISDHKKLIAFALLKEEERRGKIKKE